MRISTDKRVMAAERARNAAPKATPRQRALYFLLGAVLGAVIGYGLLTAGPGPAPSLFAPFSLQLVGGLALALGVVTALAGHRFWRLSAKYGQRDYED